MNLQELLCIEFRFDEGLNQKTVDRSFEGRQMTDTTFWAEIVIEKGGFLGKTFHFIT